MKRWIIILFAFGLCGCTEKQTTTQRHLQTLRKDIEILRVVAEHRELLWKIQEYEKKLPQFQTKPVRGQKPVIKPMYKGKEVKGVKVKVR